MRAYNVQPVLKDIQGTLLRDIYRPVGTGRDVEESFDYWPSALGHSKNTLTCTGRHPLNSDHRSGCATWPWLTNPSLVRALVCPWLATNESFVSCSNTKGSPRIDRSSEIPTFWLHTTKPNAYTGACGHMKVILIISRVARESYEFLDSTLESTINSAGFVTGALSFTDFNWDQQDNASAAPAMQW